ncbi:hypothetical protein ACQP1W_45335 [Spirillospora sp. CA-255316]
MSLLYTQDTMTAEPTLRRAVAAVVSEGTAPAEQLRWVRGVNFFVMALWDDEACREVDRNFLDLVRDSGAFALLPLALNQSTMLRLFKGDLAQNEPCSQGAGAEGPRAPWGAGAHPRDQHQGLPDSAEGLVRPEFEVSVTCVRRQIERRSHDCRGNVKGASEHAP